MAPKTVVAKLHNQASYEEGEADAALEPGQGCVLYEDAAGDQHVRPAGADEQTTRVVREQRNPPRAVGAEGSSPLGHGYDAGNHVETVGFLPFDQARCLLATGDTAAEGDEVGFNADGYLTDGGAGEVVPVARVMELYGDDLARVEFL